nr:type 1 glutamine amidotransferase [Allobranchiibius huperziae]
MVVQHEAEVGLGRFAKPLQDARVVVTIVGPGTSTPIPNSVAGFDGLIVLGGFPGAQDDAAAPWLAHVCKLISQAVADEIPYLGVCLGAQLLALVAGGAVGPARKEPEVGLGQLTLDDACVTDPLLKDMRQKARAVQWHYDEVVTLPEGSRSLISSQHCENQAFRVGASAWGLQFHAEANSKSVKEWAYKDSLNVARLGLSLRALVDQVAIADAELDSTWVPLMDRWILVVADVE